MTSEQSALNFIGRALWNPVPTITDLDARQLAFVLGYPNGWRVKRTIEKVQCSDDFAVSYGCQKDVTHEFGMVSQSYDVVDPSTNMISTDNVRDVLERESQLVKEKSSSRLISSDREDVDNEDVNIAKIDDNCDIKTYHTNVGECIDPSQLDEPDQIISKNCSNFLQGDNCIDVIYKNFEHNTNPTDILESNVRSAKVLKPVQLEKSSAKRFFFAQTGQNNDFDELDDTRPSKRRICIVDRIFAGDPSSGCDMWYNHEAAMQVADTWHDNTESTNSPYGQKGGHMLPRQPLYDIGDKVQVFYDDNWFDAKILKRKESHNGFLYQVYYSSDNSKQSKVIESAIRPRLVDKDPSITAIEIGFVTEGWKAYSTGSNKWKIVAPDGTVYKSKKAAMDAYIAEGQKIKEEGDPPWRTSGNEFIGCHILWKHTHQASARRVVKLEQIGEVTGYISETDVDRAGAPGFVSDATGKPARLYHVKFKDEPRHPYAAHLLTEQDLEESEIISSLVKDDDKLKIDKSFARKKFRKGSKND